MWHQVLARQQVNNGVITLITNEITWANERLGECLRQQRLDEASRASALTGMCAVSTAGAINQFPSRILPSRKVARKYRYFTPHPIPRTRLARRVAFFSLDRGMSTLLNGHLQLFHYSYYKRASMQCSNQIITTILE